MDSSVIFIGIRGSVHCLDRRTGQGVWSAALKGSDFVTLLLDGDRLFAGTRGEVYCLDAATGRELWHNEIRDRVLDCYPLPRRPVLPIPRRRRSVARTKPRLEQQRLEQQRRLDSSPINKHKIRSLKNVRQRVAKLIAVREVGLSRWPISRFQESVKCASIAHRLLIK